MKRILLIIFISFASCSSLEFRKCSIYDSKCQSEFIRTTSIEVAQAGGIPELNIPVIDPLQIEGVVLNILSLLNVTLIKGQVEGITTNCRDIAYETNVEERYKEVKLICSTIIIRGSYKLTSVPEFKESYADVHGDGNMTLTFGQWYFNIKYPYEIVKETDGKIYVKNLFNQATYKSAVGNLIVQINGIKKGKRDVSKTATCFINKYWRAILASDIGKTINYKSVQYYYTLYERFFNHIPADLYLTDDLSGLVDRVE